MKINEAYEALSTTRGAGDHRRVLELGIALVNAAPDDPSVRLAVASSLNALGNSQEAAKVYNAMVWHCAKAGFPLASVAAAKLAEEIEPGGLDDALGVIASLYSKGSDRIGPPALPSRPSPGPDRGADVGKVPSGALAIPELIELAAEMCESFDGASPYPEELPSIPMLSRLDEDTLLQVLTAVKVLQAGRDEVVIRQGDPGDSLFLVADGRLRVYKDTDQGERIPLAALNEGSVFGEMSLITGEPRSASVVVARDAILLELTRDRLVEMAEKAAPMAEALEAFRRERLVYNLMSVSPLFRPLGSNERFSLLQQFGTYEIKSGTTLLEEGSPGEGLYIVLHGECVVSKDGNEVAVPQRNRKCRV